MTQSKRSHTTTRDADMTDGEGSSVSQAEVSPPTPPRSSKKRVTASSSSSGKKSTSSSSNTKSSHGHKRHHHHRSPSPSRSVYSDAASEYSEAESVANVTDGEDVKNSAAKSSHSTSNTKSQKSSGSRHSAASSSGVKKRVKRTKKNAISKADLAKLLQGVDATQYSKKSGKPLTLQNIATRELFARYPSEKMVLDSNGKSRLNMPNNKFNVKSGLLQSKRLEQIRAEYEAKKWKPARALDDAADAEEEVVPEPASSSSRNKKPRSHRS